MMHSQPSNESPIRGCDLQQIPLPSSSSWERHKTLCHLFDTPFGTPIPS
jgi:hypothetical protein